MTHSKNSLTNAVKLRYFPTFSECVARESSALFVSRINCEWILKNVALHLLHLLHHCLSGFRLRYDQRQTSTKFYKPRETPHFFYNILSFLHKLLFVEIITRIFTVHCFTETLVEPVTRGYMCVTQKRFIFFFLWAFPFRSGYSGVPSSWSLRIAGSFLSVQCSVPLGQRCSLTIPNAETRLPSLSAGTLVPDRCCCQAERYNCTIYHGCTSFLCDICYAVMAGCFSLLIGLPAPRPSETRHNCNLLQVLNFSWQLLLVAVQVSCFRVRRDCFRAAKVRRARFAPPRAMQGQAVSVWHKNLPFTAALRSTVKEYFFDQNLALRQSLPL